MTLAAGEDSLTPKRRRLGRARRKAQPFPLLAAYTQRRRLTLVASVSQLLDHYAYSALLPTIPDIELLACHTDLDVVISHCKSASPDFAILDVSFPSSASFDVGHMLLEQELTRGVAFMDHRFAVWRAYKALSAGFGAYYFTRDVDPNNLCKFMVGLNNSNESSFVSTLEQLRLHDRHQILRLSKREREVFQWISHGHTVRSIAEKLGSAESTVDNHKARLMAKMEIHSSRELARVGMAVGMVDYS